MTRRYRKLEEILTGQYFLERLTTFSNSLKWQNIIEILVVSYFLYKIFSSIKGTRAVQLIRGLLSLVIIYYLADTFGFKIITWILQSGATLVIVAIPVLFQPELRRALSQLGQGLSVFPGERLLKGKELFDLTNTLVSTAKQLQDKGIGALVVLERDIGLNEYAENGVKLDSDISQELLLSLFHDGTPLHDGAVIIRQNKIIAASVVLPLTDSLKSPAGSYLGTRHRAALGISEVSDAACLVVSEETGAISIVLDGKLHRNLTEESLNRQLLEIFQGGDKSAESLPFLKRFSRSKKDGKTRKNTQELEAEQLKNLRRSKYVNRFQRLAGVLNLPIVAVLIATILGLMVTSGTTERFAVVPKEMVLPLDIEGLPEEMVARTYPDTITVRFRARRDRMENVKPEQFTLYVKANPRDKVQVLKVLAIGPSEVKLEDVKPKHVKLEIIEQKK